MYYDNGLFRPFWEFRRRRGDRSSSIELVEKYFMVVARNHQGTLQLPRGANFYEYTHE